MITMKVGTGAKAPVRFIFSDQVSETTVTVYGDDEPDTLRAKLQRVLDLEDSQGLPVRQPGAALSAAMAAEPQFTAADRAAEEARLAGVQAMGWAEDGPDIADLPEV
jgi:hypothetical protein